MNPIEKNARSVLAKLYQWKNETFDADGPTIVGASQLTAEDVNDAVSYLAEIGAVEPMGGIGTDPFDFADVKITSKGKRTHHDWTSEPPSPPSPGAANATTRAPRYPVGSPFGFKQDDWEFVSERHRAARKLHVVAGLKYKSKHYDAATLLANLESRFKLALRAFNANGQEPTVELVFERLGAGYGEHLFNHIARCIIGADIAVFDTSDLNPNVMIELGVALTWGGCVLPIRAEEAPPMPSDISGQTWVKHRDSGREFLDAGFDQKLMDLVRRALKDKSRPLAADANEIADQVHALPRIETLEGKLRAQFMSGTPGNQPDRIKWHVWLTVYISSTVDPRLTIPNHRCAGSISVPSWDWPQHPVINLGDFHMRVPCDSAPRSTPGRGVPQETRIREGANELFVDGAGQVKIDAGGWSAVPRRHLASSAHVVVQMPTTIPDKVISFDVDFSQTDQDKGITGMPPWFEWEYRKLRPSQEL